MMANATPVIQPPKHLSHSKMLPRLKWFEEGLKSCNIGPLFWIGGGGLAGGSQDFFGFPSEP